jgi:Tol biopolymer transport system component
MSFMSAFDRRIRFLSAVLVAGVATGCLDSNITGFQGGEGGTIVFSSNRGGPTYDIYRVAGDGRNLRRVLNSAEHNDLAPALSHDGRRVAFEREIGIQGGGVSEVQLWVVDIDGSNPRVVVANGSINRSPSWTAGDDALVFESVVSGNAEIYRVSVNGGAAVNLTNHPFADQSPRVSPDGSRILFHSNRETWFDIYMMDVDGSNVRKITSHPGDDRFPAWTPDGQQVVWQRFTESFDIYIMDVSGGDPLPVVADAFSDQRPSVSPDGNSVVFQSDRLPRSALYVAAIAGGPVRPLMSIGQDPSVNDLAPWWGRTAP